MTKAELVDKVYQSMLGTVLKRDVEDVIQLAFTHMKQAVRNEKRFSYPDFGTFSVRFCKARMGVNPQTGVPIKIPAKRKIVFKPSPDFKNLFTEPSA